MKQFFHVLVAVSLTVGGMTRIVADDLVMA